MIRACGGIKSQSNFAPRMALAAQMAIHPSVSGILVLLVQIKERFSLDLIKITEAARFLIPLLFLMQSAPSFGAITDGLWVVSGQRSCTNGKRYLGVITDFSGYGWRIREDQLVITMQFRNEKLALPYSVKTLARDQYLAQPFKPGPGINTFEFELKNDKLIAYFPDVAGKYCEGGNVKIQMMKTGSS
jgi:hypothetical protein